MYLYKTCRKFNVYLQLLALVSQPLTYFGRIPTKHEFGGKIYTREIVLKLNPYFGPKPLQKSIFQNQAVFKISTYVNVGKLH